MNIYFLYVSSLCILFISSDGHCNHDEVSFSKTGRGKTVRPLEIMQTHLFGEDTASKSLLYFSKDHILPICSLILNRKGMVHAEKKGNFGSKTLSNLMVE